MPSAKARASATVVKLPRSRTPKEAAALAYYVGATKAREGEAEKQLAHKAAVALGVLPDHRANPEPPGTDRTVYQGREVLITMTVVSPTVRLILNVSEFTAALVKAGVKPALLAKLERKHTHEVATAAAHIFQAGLVA